METTNLERPNDIGRTVGVIRNHQDRPPVPTVPVANELGLEVFKTRPGAWSTNISGLLRKSPDDPASFHIYVNGDHHLNRRRFTIAHEIAHFVLHRDLIGDGIAEDALYRSGLSNKVEAEANRFAAGILMPWHLLDPEIEKGITDIGELAGIFRVSRSAMSIRLGVPFETNS